MEKSTREGDSLMKGDRKRREERLAELNEIISIKQHISPQSSTVLQNI